MLDDATMRRMTGHQHTDEACESTRKLTYKDFVRFPDDGRRHEIVLQHLNLALGIYFKEHATGIVLRNIDCVFSFFDIVEPDLIAILNDRNGIMTTRNIKGAPSIVVEVLSPSTSKRDRTIKRALYERLGVREYWMIDAVRNTVAVHRLEKTGFKSVSLLRLEDTGALITDLLPGFEIALSDLFAEL